MRPKALYKYRHIDARTIGLLCNDEIYFADPTSFNDPLDTQPCLTQDCDNGRLEETLLRLVSDRQSAELHAAAKAIKYKGPKTLAHIDKLVESSASNSLREVRYLASDPDIGGTSPEENLGWMLTQRIERELLRQYDKGICAFAEHFDCPLMWSHYGDQHRGICIGYQVPDGECANLHQVTYGGSRTVSAADVAAMVVDKSARARELVDAAVLTNKAKDWQYEREWRLVGNKGVSLAPFDITDIIFGMRCPDEVKYAVIKTLQSRPRPIDFFEINSVRGTFELKRVAVDVDYLNSHFPVNSKAMREIYSDFGPIADVE